MKRRQKIALAVSAAMSVGAMGEVSQAATAYLDAFSAATGSGTAAITSSYNYTVVATGDGGVFTDGSKTNTTNQTLSLTNDATATANTNGIVYASTPTSAYTGFNQTLSSNANSLLTWSFNMQQIRTAPSGMGSGNYGAAYVLGSTTNDFANSGQGYAVLVGNTGTADSIRLFSFNNGLAPIGLNANTAGTYGSTVLSAPTVNGASPTGNVADFYSVKITLDTSTNTWTMYTRDDGAAGPFADPSTGAYTLQGSATNTASTGVALTHSGAYWAFANGANQTARFDNLRLDIDPVVGPQPPRNLTWDADASAPATDGSGTWATANSWVNQADNTSVTFDGARPDNATFGAGSGAGTASVDAGGTGQSVGQITFAANSPTYTLTGGTLTVLGYDDDANPLTANEGIIAQQSAVINNNVNWAGTAHIHVNGSGSTLTVNGALQGAGHIDKFGTGTLYLPTPAPSRSGTMDIETGVVHVTSATGGITGLGTGLTSVHSAATLWLDATGGAFTIGTSSGTMYMGDQATLRVTGPVTWDKNYPQFANAADVGTAKNSTIHVDAGGTLLFKAQIRNSDTTPENFHTIHIDGPGTVKLTNSGSNIGGDSALFSGSWDISDGKLILGQNTETGGSSGDTLNALGFKSGSTALGNTATVRGTGILIATENTPNNGSLNFYRAGLVLQGGTLAAGNGKDIFWGGPFTVNGPNSSTVAVYDPILGNTTARNVELVEGVASIVNQAGPTTWNGNLTVDPGASTGGTFKINRSGGTISVTPGATITVLQGATLDLDGTADALSDGTNHVNVANNSTTTFKVSAGVKNVGVVTGTGNMVVLPGVTAHTNGITQNNLNVGDGGRATVRARTGSPNLAASNKVTRLTTLNLNTSGTLDLNDNDLVVNYGTNADSFGDITTRIIDGFGGNDPGAIISTVGRAAGNTIHYTLDNQFIGLSEWPIASGATIDANSVIAKYTYFGDCNLDGVVNDGDYGIVDANYNTTPQAEIAIISGDANLDGSVNDGDYGIVDANYLAGSGNPLSPASIGAGQAVPEPATLGLIGVAGAGMLLRRRRTR